jgi:hypothetical protein
MNRPFNQEAYNINDFVAKEVVLEYLNNFPNLVAVDNPDRFGPDIVVEDRNRHFVYVEVERRTRWTGNKFPYGSVHIPERKRKWLSLPTTSTTFFEVSKDLKTALVIDGEVVAKSPVIKGKGTDGIEDFFDVPIKDCKYVSLVT